MNFTIQGAVGLICLIFSRWVLIATLLSWMNVQGLFPNVNFYPFIFFPNPYFAKADPQHNNVQSIATNFLLMVAFSLQHSIFARRCFKHDFLEKTLGIGIQVHRALYNGSSACMILLFDFYWRPILLPLVIENAVNFQLSTSFTFCLLAIRAMGVALIMISDAAIKDADISGSKVVFSTSTSTTPPPFVVKFPYTLIRHPTYLGSLTALWATGSMSSAYFVFCVLITAYTVTAVYFFEEPDLVEKFGEKYVSYKKKVPYRYIPFVI